MRKILLAAILLGVVLTQPGRVAAGCLGGCGGGFARPGVGFGVGFVNPYVALPPPVYYPYYPPYYPAYPYGPGPSYFRPDVPYGSNVQRNWRDTWQDDGVKLHTYTLH